jgi:hypothetical protein
MDVSVPYELIKMLKEYPANAFAYYDIFQNIYNQIKEKNHNINKNVWYAFIVRGVKDTSGEIKNFASKFVTTQLAKTEKEQALAAEQEQEFRLRLEAALEAATLKQAQKEREAAEQEAERAATLKQAQKEQEEQEALKALREREEEAERAAEAERDKEAAEQEAERAATLKQAQKEQEEQEAREAERAAEAERDKEAALKAAEAATLKAKQEQAQKEREALKAAEADDLKAKQAREAALKKAQKERQAATLRDKKAADELKALKAADDLKALEAERAKQAAYKKAADELKAATLREQKAKQKQEAREEAEQKANELELKELSREALKLLPLKEINYIKKDNYELYDYVYHNTYKVIIETDDNGNYYTIQNEDFTDAIPTKVRYSDFKIPNVQHYSYVSSPFYKSLIENYLSTADILKKIETVKNIKGEIKAVKWLKNKTKQLEDQNKQLEDNKKQLEDNKRLKNESTKQLEATKAKIKQLETGRKKLNAANAATPAAANAITTRKIQNATTANAQTRRSEFTPVANAATPVANDLAKARDNAVTRNKNAAINYINHDGRGPPTKTRTATQKYIGGRRTRRRV